MECNTRVTKIWRALNILVCLLLNRDTSLALSISIFTFAQVNNFSLHMVTDIDAIDFPEGSMSPTGKSKLRRGWNLNWDYKNLLTGYNIGMKMPEKLNPGPWVSKVTF